MRGGVRDYRLSAVASRRSKRIGSTRERIVDERLERGVTRQLDGFDATLRRLVGEVEPLGLTPPDHGL